MIQTGWMSTSTSAPFDCPIVVVSPCDFFRAPPIVVFSCLLEGLRFKGRHQHVITVRVGWGG